MTGKGDPSISCVSGTEWPDQEVFTVGKMKFYCWEDEIIKYAVCLKVLRGEWDN